jgi:hypothetical protein
MLVRLTKVKWAEDEHDVWSDVPEGEFEDDGDLLFRVDDFRNALSRAASNIALVAYLEYDKVLEVVVRASMAEIAEKVIQARRDERRL